MNEYQKCLFQYIIEKKFPNLRDRRDYRAARESVQEAEEKLLEMLTDQQREQFEQYTDRSAYMSWIELEQLFQETMTACHALKA